MSTRSKEHRERVEKQNAEYEYREQYRLALSMSKGLPKPVVIVSEPRNESRRKSRAMSSAMMASVIGGLALRNDVKEPR